ncbi:hypothetical protein DACRYDRAFT_118910 [Dacryopinax primogenitus]|uniref:Uncharacterized protein n=1 Tax=Dacryopinax primogenitus (strain DJM 731) TaxID=1858805 RepID=M5G346_DACPD|nr:uncharacterized protein DACRYDRAFT_118910 [Dacryopinax primogenitus]EJT98172.1 hypothetical protein DACRYDRAFT_118910 [Dacryopinax primogenitus]
MPLLNAPPPLPPPSSLKGYLTQTLIQTLVQCITLLSGQALGSAECELRKYATRLLEETYDSNSGTLPFGGKLRERQMLRKLFFLFGGMYRAYPTRRLSFHKKGIELRVEEQDQSEAEGEGEEEHMFRLSGEAWTAAQKVTLRVKRELGIVRGRWLRDVMLAYVRGEKSTMTPSNPTS